MTNASLRVTLLQEKTPRDSLATALSEGFSRRPGGRSCPLITANCSLAGPTEQRQPGVATLQSVTTPAARDVAPMGLCPWRLVYWRLLPQKQLEAELFGLLSTAVTRSGPSCGPDLHNNLTDRLLRLLERTQSGRRCAAADRQALSIEPARDSATQGPSRHPAPSPQAQGPGRGRSPSGASCELHAGALLLQGATSSGPR